MTVRQEYFRSQEFFVQHADSEAKRKLSVCSHLFALAHSLSKQLMIV